MMSSELSREQVVEEMEIIGPRSGIAKGKILATFDTLRQRVEALEQERKSRTTTHTAIVTMKDEEIQALTARVSEVEQNRDQIATQLNEYIAKLEACEQERDEARESKNQCVIELYRKLDSLDELYEVKVKHNQLLQRQLQEREETIKQLTNDPGCSMAGRIDCGHGINGECDIRKEKCPPACLLKQIRGREANENGLNLELTTQRARLDVLTKERDFARQQADRYRQVPHQWLPSASDQESRDGND